MTKRKKRIKRRAKRYTKRYCAVGGCGEQCAPGESRCEVHLYMGAW